MPNPHLPAVLARADADLDASLARLVDLIRIPSISTDSAYARDCQRAADWLAADLASIGFDASARATTGHPMVVGHDHASSGPRVLFYGHYDVQPVDPLALWTSDPFEPALAKQPDCETWITGRGSSDDKGQLMTFVEACRAWKAVTGGLPIKVSILFEGEEESGSPSLEPFFDAHGEELKSDVVLICDTDMWDRATPAITAMLRGIAKEEMTITCASRDLHSGIYGSAARNPLQLISEIIASLRAPDGSVAIDGFYDGVIEPPSEVVARWKELGFDAKGFLGDIGLSIAAGETNRSLMEQVWTRPTCEINGLWGGYNGEGSKTVIPSQAHAKITFRLVAGQDPEHVREAFRAHVRARMPGDCKVAFEGQGGGAATVMPFDSPFLRKALGALTDEWEREAAVAATGGSIPIATAFKDRLGMDSLLIGFAQLDNRIHSPNEKYDLTSFRKGIRSWIRILAGFAG